MKKQKLSLIIVFFSLLSYGQELQITQPSNKVVVHQSNLSISWNAVDTACFYHLQIASDSSFTSIYLNHDSLTNQTVSYSGFNRGYYWCRVRVRCNSNFSDWGAVSKFGVYNLLTSDSLKIHLDPNQGVSINSSNKLISWQNSAGSGITSQSDTNRQPVLTNTLSKKNMLSFDGIDDFLQFPHHAYTEFTMLLTARFEPNSTNKAVFCKLNNSWNSGFAFTYLNNRQHFRTGNTTSFNDYYGALNSNSAIYCDAATYTVNQRQFFRFGLPSAAQAGAFTITYNTSPFCIGTHWAGTTGWHFKGGIGDILFFASALPDSVIKLASEYIMHTYAPPVNLGFDRRITYGFCSDTLDAGAHYESYLWSTGDTVQKIAVYEPGKYWVRVKDIFGFFSSDTVLVYNTVPQLEYSDTTICLGDTLSLLLPFAPSFPLPLGLSEYSFLWSTSDTTSSLALTQPGQYWVRVADTLGCFVTDTFTLALDSFPAKASLGPDLNFCAGNSIALTQGQNEAQNYLWSTADTTASIVIQTAGTYSLRVSNGRGCVAEDSINISIRGIAPAVSFGVDSVCLGSASVFADSSYALDASNLVSWQWSFGDGDSAFVQNTVHVFAAPGTYNVRLTVATDSLCGNTFERTAYVFKNPLSSFQPYHACSGEAVDFRDLSQAMEGVITEWHWSFGDTASGSANVSQLPSPTHIFHIPGNYFVSLKVKTQYDCLDSITVPVVVRESPQPLMGVSQVCLGDTTLFTDLSPFDATNPVVWRRWSVGTGDTLVGLNPVYLYAAAGKYVVSLEVRSMNGCMGRTEDTAVVAEIPLPLISSGVFCQGMPGWLNDNTLNSVERLWVVDGQMLSTDQSLVYAFADTLVHSVRLWVRSTEGCEAEDSTYIKVYPLPEARFSISPEYGEPPLDVQFTNLSTGAISYVWDFGDGNSSVLEHPENTFMSSGVYGVKLLAYSPFGCPDSFVLPVYVIATDVDLVAEKAYVQRSWNTLFVSVDVLNRGSRRMREMDFFARPGTGVSLRERWEGVLDTGQRMTYIFKGALELYEGQAADFLCVTVLPVAPLMDVEEEDNRFCLSLVSEFKVMEPYPNPASGMVRFRVILPFTGSVRVEVFSAMGVSMVNKEFERLPAGLNEFEYDVSMLTKGVYTVKVSYNDEAVVRRVVVN